MNEDHEIRRDRAGGEMFRRLFLPGFTGESVPRGVGANLPEFRWVPPAPRDRSAGQGTKFSPDAVREACSDAAVGACHPIFSGVLTLGEGRLSLRAPRCSKSQTLFFP